jgi:hypothetical protein
VGVKSRSFAARKKLVEPDPSARAWQVDRPHVVQGNAREELMCAQRQPFELSLLDLRHDLSFSNALSFAG